jgi:TetR/AcrR family transcriptional regulator
MVDDRHVLFKQTSPPMSKKPANPKKTRRGHPSADMPPAIDKIRNAALMLFSRQGYEGTSIGEIAALAGVAKPLIHYHFSSKEELWYSVIDAASGTLLKELEAFRTAALGLPPEQVIAMLAATSVQSSFRFFHVVSIIDDEARSTGPRSDYLLKVLQKPSLTSASAIVDILNGMLRKGKEPIPAEHLVPAFMGAATFPFVNQKAMKGIFGSDVRDEDYALRHTAFLTSFLRSLFMA